MFIPIKYNIRYLINRWTGTLMTAMTFALVVAIFIIVMSLARGLERALGTSGDPLNVLVLRTGVQAEGQSAVSIEQFQIVRDYPGIARDDKGQAMAAPEVFVLINKPKRSDGKTNNLQIRGVHPLAFKLRPAVRLVQGRMFRPGLREVIVSRTVANRFQDMRLGERPTLGKGRWTVVGIFEAQGTAFDSEMWGDYQELMQEFNRSAYNTVVLRILAPSAAGAIKKLVEDDRRIKLTAKTEQAYYQEQTKVAGPLKAFGTFLAIVMSVGASFAGMNTMYASVASRVKEIGTLRILGFSRLSILTCFLIESVALAFFGGVLGCLFALPLDGLAAATTNFETFSEIMFFFSITPDLMLTGIVFAVVMGAIGGLLPAFSAARQPIMSALKQV